MVIIGLLSKVAIFTSSNSISLKNRSNRVSLTIVYRVKSGYTLVTSLLLVGFELKDANLALAL
jgi:hypothetical protein